MFIAMDRVPDSGRRALEELVNIVKGTLDEYSKKSLKITTSYIKNEHDRSNLVKQAKSLGQQ